MGSQRGKAEGKGPSPSVLLYILELSCVQFLESALL